MTSADLSRAIALTLRLLELHETNEFKVRGWRNAETALERVDAGLLASGPDATALQAAGLSKGMATTFAEALAPGGTLPELDRLLALTPPGVLKILNVKGLGPKRVRQLWLEAGIETPEALMDACETGAVAKIKGFGAKMQDAIREALEYVISVRGQVLLSKADALAADLVHTLLALPAVRRAEVAGDTRRALETVAEVCVVVATTDAAPVLTALDAVPGLVAELARSGPRAWRGHADPEGPFAGVPVAVLLTSPAAFVTDWLLATGAAAHLDAPLPPAALEWLTPPVAPAGVAPPAMPHTFRHVLTTGQFQTETAAYAAVGLRQCIEPELREGRDELARAAAGTLPELIKMSNLRGALHNHSTYSDGAHTLRQMAEFLRDAGYQYLGIADHSRAAQYAGGLPDWKVRQQWREIDELNLELAPFRIFKGIESDILADGALDYDDELLAGFDFVVASVHSGLRMDEAKATARLLRAIENPFTTFLGHPTGRLLLRRTGYPLDFKVIIDACAHHGVAIELNSSPHRLDLDWRWLTYALEKGVLTALNPDAHSIAGYADMAYGVRQGRKAYLTADKCLNAWSTEALAAYFEQRKKGRA